MHAGLLKTSVSSRIAFYNQVALGLYITNGVSTVGEFDLITWAQWIGWFVVPFIYNLHWTERSDYVCMYSLFTLAVINLDHVSFLFRKPGGRPYLKCHLKRKGCTEAENTCIRATMHQKEKIKGEKEEKKSYRGCKRKCRELNWFFLSKLFLIKSWRNLSCSILNPVVNPNWWNQKLLGYKSV